MRTDDRFNEIAQKVMCGIMSQQAGADAVGMPLTTFRYHLNRAFPERPRGVQVEKGKRSYPNGTGRPRGSAKTETVLETLFTDKQMCVMMIETDKCHMCPLMDPIKGCTGCEGLVYAMLRKVPKRHV